jgi:lysophospholipase L1-like esterase
MRKLLITSLVLNLLLVGGLGYIANHLLDRFSLSYILCKIRLGPCPYESNVLSRHYYFKKGPKLKNPVVMLGDSLTELGHWNEFFSRGDIMNRGISGDTTLDIIMRLNEVVSLKPRLVFLMAGTNDVLGNDAPELVINRFEQILDKLQSADIPVVAQTVPMISRHFSSYERMNQRLAHYNHLIRTSCQLRGIKVVEIGPALSPKGYLMDPYTTDGTHLNWRGYMIWRGVLYNHLPPPMPGSGIPKAP